jgi:hypothetical protein
LLRLQIRKLEPRQRVFEVAPDGLNRVQLGAIGRQPDRPGVGGPAEPLGRVGAAVIQEQEVQAIGVCLGQRLEKDLEHLGIEIGEFEKAALARDRRDRAVDREPLEDVLNRSDGLDSASDEAAAHSQQAQPTFVLAEHAYRLGMRWRDDALELLLTGRLKLCDGLRVFLCDWAVAP